MPPELPPVVPPPSGAPAVPPPSAVPPAPPVSGATSGAGSASTSGSTASGSTASASSPSSSTSPASALGADVAGALGPSLQSSKPYSLAASWKDVSVEEALDSAASRPAVSPRSEASLTSFSALANSSAALENSA